MSTAARIDPTESAHWYTATGEPMHTVKAKSTGEPRNTTLADAKKLNLLPSVTTILKVLDKPALTSWKIEQAVTAVMTTPQQEGEPLDAFIYRVLHTEQVQNEETVLARDLGTDMHEGLEALFRGEQISEELRPWIEPAYLGLKEHFAHWEKIEVETVLVGNGYAGRADFIGHYPNGVVIVDFKTTKKLPPKASWPEHRLQLSAYAAAQCLRAKIDGKSITTANLYISTVDCCMFRLFENPPWMDDYLNGFAPLIAHWQWATGHRPQQGQKT